MTALHSSVRLLMALSMIATLAFVAPPPADAATFPIEFVSIEASDGASIPLAIARPDGPGPHPIVIAPSSWGINRLEYIVPAAKWAEAGFLVVSFTARGFWESAEEIDIAGPRTVEDVSDIIDWAVEQREGDPERVGAYGISYGGGISLLAAARDSRIDAVVSMSGWADLEAALYPNQTLNKSAADILLTLGDITGRPGPLLQQVAAVTATGDVEAVLPLLDDREPINMVDQLNANGVAVQIQQAWNDGIFAPGQILPLYDALTGPRKLIIAPGDHAIAELPGLLGLPNTQFDEALVWMQAHVAGEPVTTGDEVMTISNDNRRLHSADSWDAIVGQDTALTLTQPRSRWWSPHTGQLTQGGSPSWTTSIKGDRATIADSGAAMVTGTLQALGIPQTAIIGFVDRRGAAVWKTDRIWQSQDILGSPSLDITMTPSNPDTTVIAYLYEQTWGVASLIAHKAISIRDAVPGEPVDLAFDLEPTSWNIARGSRLILVLDTVDARYDDVTSDGTVKFSSSDGSAVLTVPLR